METPPFLYMPGSLSQLPDATDDRIFISFESKHTQMDLCDTCDIVILYLHYEGIYQEHENAKYSQVLTYHAKLKFI